MICCGQDRDSKFCPECGQKMFQHPLESLLEHCERTAKNYENRAERWKHAAGNPRIQKLSSQTAKNAEKWRAWSDALREQIDKDQAK